MRKWPKSAEFPGIYERYKEWAGRKKQEKKTNYAKNPSEKTI
jgi:hypothetical protein